MPPAAAEEPWAILGAIPYVEGYKYKETKRTIPPGTDIAVARNEPPQASVLTVAPHISLPPCFSAYPYVAAADLSGLLLLCGAHPVSSVSTMVSYHIYDARTGEVVSLPNPPRRMAFYAANVGLITKADGCMVAGLQSAGCHGTGGATATLLISYMVGEGGKWREREITTSSPPLLPHDWYPAGVVSHGGMLWWVDLSYGLLTCDPFTDNPELLHVPLPHVPDELAAIDRMNRGARRCVKVSGGRLRYVQLHGKINAPVVSTWVLVPSTWSPGEWEWISEFSVSLAEVWTDESYVNTMLPARIPALAFLHPTNPDRVYFFLQSCIFVVDLQLRKVVGSNEFEMLDPPRRLRLKRSSRFVHAWQYDPSNTRPDYVSRCMRQEKAIAAMNSFSGINPGSHRNVKRLKRVWDSVTRERQQQEQKLQQMEQKWRQQVMLEYQKKAESALRI